MNRIHLFEIEDLSWCPTVIREALTDFLFGLSNMNVYKSAYHKIYEILDKTNTNSIIDCCSGTGGPIKKLRNYLDNHQKKDITITLTDKYPNFRSFEKIEKEYPGKINSITQPVDATEIPSSLKGLRTFFSSFHHFKPEHAAKILEDAVKNDVPIAIFESTQCRPVDFFLALVSPLAVWIILPFSKQLTLWKFILTYILPVIPFAFMWEYLVSNLRTYSLRELHALTQKIQAENYHWEYGKLKSGIRKNCVIYLIGYRK